MDFDFIRFGWPNTSFIAALAVIPIAVALVMPVSHVKVAAIVPASMTADGSVIID